MEDEEDFPCLSPTSSAFNALDDGAQGFRVEWPESTDGSEYSANFLASLMSSPTAGFPSEFSLMPHLGPSSNIDSGFGSMETSPALSFTDLPNPAMYATSPRNSVAYSNAGTFTGIAANFDGRASRGNMARSLTTDIGSGHGNANMALETSLVPRHHYRSLDIEASGSSELPELPVMRSSRADSFALDQMIRQLASHRVYEIQGGEYATADMAGSVFVEDQDLDFVTSSTWQT
jgi:hypothetical protein